MKEREREKEIPWKNKTYNYSSFNWAIPGLFFRYACIFYVDYLKQLIVNKIADECILTANLWCRSNRSTNCATLPPVNTIIIIIINDTTLGQVKSLHKFDLVANW